MKPTKIINLLIVAACGFAVNFVVTKFALAKGGTVAIIPASLDISLLATAVIELLLAIPIFRFRRDMLSFAKGKTSAGLPAKRVRRVDSFYAVRLLALAKSTALFGALFFGFAIALVISQLLLPVIPDSIIQNIVVSFVTLVLIFVALLIERACKLPKPDAEAAPNAETNPA